VLPRGGGWPKKGIYPALLPDYRPAESALMTLKILIEPYEGSMKYTAIAKHKNVEAELPTKKWAL